MVKLRGLPGERYTAEELRRIWFAIGCHLGTPVFQNRRGELCARSATKAAEAQARPGDDGGGRGKSLSLLLCPHPHQRRIALPHRPHGCGGAALRPAGQCRRNQPAGQLRRHPQRDAAAAARSAGSPLWGFSPKPLRRGGGSPAVAYALPVFGLRAGKFTSHSRSPISRRRRWPKPCRS